MSGVNNPEVTRGVVLQPPVTLETEFAWYENISKRGNLIFAILLHQKDSAGIVTGYRYIGHTGLHDLTWPGGYCESGSLIIDPTCFGKGYGTEAKLLLLYEAFRVRGFRKVCSRVKAFNGNSWGHLLACGFKQVGRHKSHHFDNGNFVDSISLEIFREDWEPIWANYQKTKSLPRLTDEQHAQLEKETSIF